MKVWVAHLSDGYGLSRIALRHNFDDAHAEAIKLMKIQHGDDVKFNTVKQYDDVHLVVRERDPEEFFPGEAEVMIYIEEVK